MENRVKWGKILWVKIAGNLIFYFNFHRRIKDIMCMPIYNGTKGLSVTTILSTKLLAVRNAFWQFFYANAPRFVLQPSGFANGSLIQRLCGCSWCNSALGTQDKQWGFFLGPKATLLPAGAFTNGGVFHSLNRKWHLGLDSGPIRPVENVGFDFFSWIGLGEYAWMIIWEKTSSGHDIQLLFAFFKTGLIVRSGRAMPTDFFTGLWSVGLYLKKVFKGPTKQKKTRNLFFWIILASLTNFLGAQTFFFQVGPQPFSL